MPDAEASSSAEVEGCIYAPFVAGWLTDSCFAEAFPARKRLSLVFSSFQTACAYLVESYSAQRIFLACHLEVDFVTAWRPSVAARNRRAFAARCLVSWFLEVL